MSGSPEPWPRQTLLWVEGFDTEFAVVVEKAHRRKNATQRRITRGPDSRILGQSPSRNGSYGGTSNRTDVAQRHRRGDQRRVAISCNRCNAVRGGAGCPAVRARRRQVPEIRPEAWRFFAGRSGVTWIEGSPSRNPGDSDTGDDPELRMASGIVELLLHNGVTLRVAAGELADHQLRSVELKVRHDDCQAAGARLAIDD